MKRYFFYTLLILLFSISNKAFATHNRAGEITYRQIGPLSIEVKITTYTKISGQAIHADRPSLEIHWGDGSLNTIPRNNFVMVHPDIRRNEYIATHTYPGPNPGGQPYIMWMQDPNRNENILNINGGNSVNVEFYLQTEVFLFATSIFGNNSSSSATGCISGCSRTGQNMQPLRFESAVLLKALNTLVLISGSYTLQHLQREMFSSVLKSTSAG
jgi:hypothetical protein